MHDAAYPFLNVTHAGGPGVAPFSICSPSISQTSMTQFALPHTTVSSLRRYTYSSPTIGDNEPMRAFQSPQTTGVALHGMTPTTASTWLRASASLIPRFAKFWAGGTYTLPTHSRSPPGTCM